MKRENYLQVRDYARQMRCEMTWAEQRVWRVIQKRQCGGYRFLRQRVVGRFILDFYCAEKRLALEIDGEIHLRPDIEQYDQRREAHLISEANVTFLRLSNAEVLRLTDQQLHQHILATLEALPPPNPPS